MNNQDYEQKKRECWEEFRALDRKSPYSLREVNAFAFDRGYSLGRETESITQEEIEKASVEYADKTAEQYEVCNSEFVQEIMVAFEQGAQFALGKQEKDADSFEIGDKVRVKGTNQIGTIIEPYSNDTGYRVYFDDGDGGEDAEYSADQLELYKKIIAEPNDADTVIQGWVARDKDGYLVLHYKKPHRTFGNTKWYSAQSQKSLPRDSFPDLTWSDDPIEVEITIKRKKK